MNRILHATIAALIATSAITGIATSEETPTSLPGAEAFVFRKGKPESLRLFVVKPDSWKASDRRPALMWFFGGGWTKGSPEKSIGWARWAAKFGMVGIAPDYRTRNRFNTSPLESVADSRAALRWLQDHAGELGIDPKRVVVGGGSAGGHVALWTGIKATPPGSNANEAPATKPLALILSSAVSDTSILKGYTPKRFGDHAKDLSPAHQLDKKMPPTLIFHGDADKVVPYHQSVSLHQKLIDSGNDSQLVTVPGGTHNFSSDTPGWKSKSRKIIEEFLRANQVTPNP